MARFVAIDERTLEKSAEQGRRDRRPRAQSARFDRRTRRIFIRLDAGIEIAFDPRLAHGLSEASVEDLSEVRIDGHGSTLHFPKLDADFSIARLLEGFLGPLEWTRREARAAASRANGKLGGRPRKLAAAG